MSDEQVQTKRAFKVGDRVAVTKDNAESAIVQNGDEGVVSALIHGSSYEVVMDHPRRSWVESWDFHSSSLRLIESPSTEPSPSEQVQGQIQVGSVFEWVGDRTSTSDIIGVTFGEEYTVVDMSKDRLWFLDDHRKYSFILRGTFDILIEWISHPTPSEPAPEQVEIDDGGPVHPSQPCGADGLPCCEAVLGMSLRDWFAGQHLAGLGDVSDWKPSEVATYAYRIADAMIAARKIGGAQ